MNFALCSVNGQVVPRAQAVVSVLSIEYLYGFGVYETLRVVGGMPYFLDQHIDRLLHSASQITLEHTLTAPMVIEWVRALCARSEPATYNIKILLIGASTPEKAQCWILPLSPLFLDKKLISEGAATITVEYERQFPQAKTLNMLGSFLAYRSARWKGCYDALLVDRQGFIREGTRTNFFIVSGSTLTKPPKEDILDGVMQRFVLAVARANGFAVNERRISKDDATNADGAFLTSVSSKVLPIRTMDDIVLNIPESVKRLQKLVEKEYAHS